SGPFVFRPLHNDVFKVGEWPHALGKALPAALEARGFSGTWTENLPVPLACRRAAAEGYDAVLSIEIMSVASMDRMGTPAGSGTPVAGDFRLSCYSTEGNLLASYKLHWDLVLTGKIQNLARKAAEQLWNAEGALIDVPAAR